MKDFNCLRNELNRINGKGYKAYKDIQGQYKFSKYILSIDYVQGDPFASPSRIRVLVNQNDAKIPRELYDTKHKKIAITDFLTRTFSKNIYKLYDRVKGSGKSGILKIDSCGQEVLQRTSITISEKVIEARLEVGLPAAGRRVLSKEAEEIFFERLPEIVYKSLFYSSINQKLALKHVQMIEDQEFIRGELNKRGLVAFIANDSILPRENGVSQRPMREGAIPFKSPEDMEIELNCPHRGLIKGMGIAKGISLIVGGGYHGKSTLLKAIELGVYNHIEGDGREFVITDESAVKIRAEDGRSIEKVNITTFINNLPNGKDTYKFSSDNASGSTSQAANIIEALEMGCNLLLIDEDTSATNFMIRDRNMQELVSKYKEPITPFIDRVKELYTDYGISTILVAGSSGEYFREAHKVIMMDKYTPIDVTRKAKLIYRNSHNTHEEIVYSKKNLELETKRILLSSTFNKGNRGVKIKSKGLNTILYDKDSIDLSYVEQLVHISQVNSIANILRYAMDHIVDNKKTIKDIIESIYLIIENRGLEELSQYKGHPGNMAMPRKFEVAATFNRFRRLHIK